MLQVEAYNISTMAIIARLVGEGIGPFKSFDFDFSDGAGNSHPGPHIFAGVNGTGKSTILRTLAWMLESDPDDGFDWEEWNHLTQGYTQTRAMEVLVSPVLGSVVFAKAMDTSDGSTERLHSWTKEMLAKGNQQSLENLPLMLSELWPLDNDALPTKLRGRRSVSILRMGGPEVNLSGKTRILGAGYGPSRLLKYLPEVDLSIRLQDAMENALSFGSTVQNKAIQSWLLGLFSKRAIARERHEHTTKYSSTLGRFEHTLQLMCDQDVKFDVDIEPSLQPRLLMYHKRLDFSQLPDGVRSTVGWLADFLMRMDLHDWQPENERANILLLDEVDAHLHPKWQRSILPSIKEVLPEVQVFATSHSPFVIASCPGARIHVLELDAEGQAYNRPPEDAPIGESILATMKDIFGVSSRFDIETEKLLDEWNRLKRSQAVGKLSGEETAKLSELTQELSRRSEELRQTVSSVIPISNSLITSLQSKTEPARQRSRKARK